MGKNQIQLIVLGAMMLVVTGVLVYQFVITPGKGAPGSAAGAPVDYRSQLIKAEMLVKSIPQQREEVARLGQEVDAYAPEIPMEDDQTWLSRQINKISGMTGMSDVSQRYQGSSVSDFKFEGELQEKYAEKAWEIRMKCGFHELGNFLSELENTSRFLEIKDISIEGNDPGGQKVVLLVQYLARRAATRAK
ncbi:MAG: type 4a pilus biogenesis protein PilO [Candidatus Aureabacteria bacterium]|nr:type 4a pilus biogenesis protein PilO [Candidatus Auribacterota bacterium]